MCIAQKTLKSMSSITNDLNEENDDLDELIYTPNSGAVTPDFNLLMSGRQPSLIPPADENYTIDAPSENLSEFQINTINSRFIR
jgi:hypothetical protein